MTLMIGLAKTGFAQVTQNPDCFEFADPNLKVDKVLLTIENTVIYLTYQNRSSLRTQISIDPFTIIREKNSTISHTMIRFHNISVSPRKTIVEKKSGHSFILYFPAVSAGCKEIDLITCPVKSCLTVRGIEFRNANLLEDKSEAKEKEQLEYDYLAVYDQRKKKWGKWQRGRYVFILKSGAEKSIKLYMNSGEILHFKILSDQFQYEESGHKFRYIECMVSNNVLMGMKIFENGDILVFYPEGEAYQFTNY